MGTMKLVILEELFRKLNAPPDPQTSALISETVSMAGTRSANELLALIGGGDAAAGVTALNASMRKLGLKSTFMAAPYDQAGPRVTTPANSKTDVNTQADPNMQTTPREIGMVMQMLVECEQGGGTLLAAYSGQITQAECQKILEYLKLNEITALILSGLPQGTRAVHRHGYTSDTEGDVAVIWGPTGPYVLSIFLYKPSWLEWDFASETMGDLSKIIWSYFTLASQQ
jgi:beta-lactamase class A